MSLPPSLVANVQGLAAINGIAQSKPHMYDTPRSLLIDAISWMATLRAASCASSSLTSCPTFYRRTPMHVTRQSIIGHGSSRENNCRTGSSS